MKSLRYILGAGAVLVLLAIVLWLRATPAAKPGPYTELVDIAKEACLVNSEFSHKVELLAKLELVKKLDGVSSVEERRKEVRGAIDGLSEQLKLVEQNEVRQCMQRYTDRIFALADQQFALNRQ